MTDWIKTADEMPPPDRWVLGWFEGAHRARVDVEALVRCCVELVKRDVL
jgi:hypothetical protein